MTAVCLLVAIALVALAAWRRLRAAYWRRRAEREWAATCARTPWRVAAVLDGGPLVMLAGDDALRAWWEAEGRAIVEGRTTAPTDAEIAAHAAVGGKWRVRAQWNRNGERRMVDTVNSWAPQIAALLREQSDTHWWATDADDALCAWPVAT